VIVGVAVTLTLAATLFASWAWGFTLNRVSLFALIFSIGILVDDAIVVVENIHRWQGLHPGKTLLEIIPPAVDEVGGPTILATLTVIAALLPMAFVTGLMGPYMSPIPINSSMGMAISLAVAFVVTPWLALKLMKSHGGAAGEHQPSKLDAKTRRTFRKLLTPFLDPHKGGAARLKLAVAVVLMILGSVSLAYFQLVVLKMLPFDNKSEFQVVLDMPVGTPVEETARVLHEIGALARSRMSSITRPTPAPPARSTSTVWSASTTCAPRRRRATSRSTWPTSSSVRGRATKSQPRCASASRPSARRMAASPRSSRCRPGRRCSRPSSPKSTGRTQGPDQRRQAGAGGFRADAGPGCGRRLYRCRFPKFVLHVLQSKAALLGVAQSDIVEVVGMGLAGQDVTPARNTESKFEIPVRVTLPAEKQSNLDALLKLRVRSRDGQLVPVSELVEVRDMTREKTIYHKDLLPVVYVVGDMGGKLDSPLYGMFDVRARSTAWNSRKAARSANGSSASRATPTPATASNGTANGR
jgi:multidrug efflux pump subunit AcrB